MSAEITLLHVFETLVLSVNQSMDVILSSHFSSKETLHFRLLDSPHWLRVDNNRLIGKAPAVRKDAQFVVTIAAFNAQDLYTTRFLIEVRAQQSMLDSLASPLLQLSMVNKPQCPREPFRTTRAVLTYIFGYYQTHPHGEQFFAKLRDKANRDNKHLSEHVTESEFIEFMESHHPQEQHALLAEMAESDILEFAERRETASEPAESVAHEHSLLAHVYHYLHANHPEVLHEFLHHHEAHHAHGPHHSEQEQFEAVVTSENPDIEKQLTEALGEAPILKKAKFTEPDIQHFYIEKQLEIEAHTANHIVFHELTEEASSKAQLQQLLCNMQDAFIQEKQETATEQVTLEHHLSFFPHP